MKKCYNCKGMNRDSDIYCRNCGYRIQNARHYVLINIGTALAFIGLLFVVTLFIASYLVD